MGRYSYSDILFAQPSLVSGMCRVLDMGSTFTAYNDKPTEQQADIAAIKSDWMTVGGDLRHTVEEFSR